jgi:hypothetical protein
MGVGMIIAILVVVAIVPQPSSETLPLPLTAFLIGATKTIGVLASVLPKLRWSAFRPNRQGDLPYLAWLTSAVLAAFVSLLIERAAIAIAHPAALAALDFGKYPLTPLAPATFAISLCVSILCDVDLGIGRGWILRIADGMLCGAAMITCMFICLRLLELPSTTAARTAPWFPFAFSFSLGFIAGVFAPYLYRKQRGEEPQIQAGSSAVIQAHSAVMPAP